MNQIRSTKENMLDNSYPKKLFIFEKVRYHTGNKVFSVLTQQKKIDDNKTLLRICRGPLSNSNQLIYSSYPAEFLMGFM